MTALPRLCAISPEDADDAALAAWASAILDATDGAVILQLRQKQCGGRDLVRRARALVDLARPRGARVLVNDRVDIATAAGADGVQLPEAGFPVDAARALLPAGALVGASRHDVAGVAAAARDGADLIIAAPAWPTPSKPGVTPLGPDGLTLICTAADGVPLFALGGVDDPARATTARAAGCYGVAGIRGFRDAAAARTLAEAVGPAPTSADSAG